MRSKKQTPFSTIRYRRLKPCPKMSDRGSVTEVTKPPEGSNIVRLAIITDAKEGAGAELTYFDQVWKGNNADKVARCLQGVVESASGNHPRSLREMADRQPRKFCIAIRRYLPLYHRKGTSHFPPSMRLSSMFFSESARQFAPIFRSDFQNRAELKPGGVLKLTLSPVCRVVSPSHCAAGHADCKAAAASLSAGPGLRPHTGPPSSAQ